MWKTLVWWDCEPYKLNKDINRPYWEDGFERGGTIWDGTSAHKVYSIKVLDIEMMSLRGHYFHDNNFQQDHKNAYCKCVIKKISNKIDIEEKCYSLP